MNNLYPRLDQDAIKEATLLYEKLEKAASSQSVINPNDYLLMQTPNGLDFIKKRSFKALYLRTINKIKMFFGCKDIFDLSKNLDAAATLVTQATKADNKFFQTVSPEIRENVTALGIYLKRIESSNAMKKPIEKNRVITSKIKLFDKKIEKTASSYHFSSRNELLKKIEPQLQHHIPELTASSRNEIAHYIFTDERRDELLDALSQSDSEKAKEVLYDHLLRALSTAKKEKAASLCTLLDQIKKPERGSNFNFDELKHFGLIFGDSFIQDSGLEGDYSSEPYAKLVEQFLKERSLQTEMASKLSYLMTHYIDLRAPVYQSDPDALKRLLEKTVNNCPGEPKKALLFGGWQRHAIVFEVTKEKTGTYSFRVYNEGEGIEHHHRLQSGYKTKFAGFLGVTNINKNALFSENVLASLAKLSAKDRNGAQILVDHIIPLLGGKEEAPDPDTTHFLSPQRSGTCAYRSLHAFIASNLSQTEYKYFKFEFKHFLLQEYLQKVKGLNATAIPSEDSYHNAKLAHSVMTRSLEKFSNGLKKLQLVIPDSQIKACNKTILEMRFELEKLESALVQFEKNAYSHTVEDVKASPLLYAMPTPQRVIKSDAGESVLSNPLSNTCQQTLEKIRSENLHDPEVLEAVLEQIAQVPIDELGYTLDTFCKKFGPPSKLETITFKNPEQVEEILGKLFNRHKLSLNQNNSRLYYGSWLFISFAHESAFRQLPKSSRPLTLDNATYILSSEVLKKAIEYYIGSDPYWVDALQDLLAVAKKKEPKTISDGLVDLRNSNKFTVSKAFAEEFWNWWMDDDQKELRQRVEKSITSDREKQKIEIENRKKTLENQIQAIDRIILSVKKQVEEQEKKVSDLQKIIDKEPAVTHHYYYTQSWNERQLESEKESLRQEKIRLSNHEKSRGTAVLQFNRVEQAVENDLQYWPKGFETDELDLTYKVQFLLGEKPNFFMGQIGINDPIPTSFRRYFIQIVRANNLLYNTLDLPKIESTENREQKTIMTSTGTEFLREYTRWDFDNMHKSLNHTHLYETIFSKRYPEGAIPRQAQQKLSNMDSDIARELLSLRQDPNIQIESTLLFFQQNQEFLQKKEYIAILFSLLFEDDLLLKRLQNNDARDELVEKLQSFFSKTIEHAISLSDLETASTLFWIASLCEKQLAFATKIPQTVENLSIIDPEIGIRLVDAVTNPALAHMRAVVIENFVAAASCVLEKKAETAMEKKFLAYLLVCHTARSSNPVDESKLFQSRSIDIQSTQEKIREETTRKDGLFSTELLQSLFDDSANDLFAKLYPSLKNERFVFQENSLDQAEQAYATLSLSSATITPKDKNLLRVYKNSLTEKEKAFIEKYDLFDSLDHLRAYREANNLFIYDAKSDRYLLFTDYSLFIRDSLESPWQECVKPADTTYIYQQPLRRDCQHRKVGKAIHIYKKNSLAYVIENNIVKRCDRKDLQLAKKPDPSFLDTFESEDEMLFWQDSNGVLAQIELPRLQLTLTNKNGTFHIEEMPGYIVAKEQFIPQLGQKTGYLVIENTKGEKKALFPVWPPEEQENEALTADYLYDFDTDKKTVDVASYTVDDHLIKPDTLQARYYLASIFLHKGQIDEAEKLLLAHSAETVHRKLTDNEKKLLKQIVYAMSSQDKGSRTIALRLRALYLLEKNRRQFEKSESPENDEQKINLLETYLNRLGHVRTLEPNVEITLLESVKNPSNLIIKRLCNLKGSIDRSIIQQLEINRKELLNIWGYQFPYIWPKKYYESKYQESRKEHAFPFNPLTVTDNEFSNYAQLIRQEVSKNKKPAPELVSALTYMSFFSDDAQVQKAARYLLRYISQSKTIRDKKTKDNVRVEETKIIDQVVQELSILDHLPGADDEITILKSIKYSFFDETESIEKSEAMLDFSPDATGQTDPTIRKKFTDLKCDMAASEKEQIVYHHTLKSGKELGSLKQAVEEKRNEAKELLVEMDSTILQTVSNALIFSESSHHDFLAKKRRLPSTDELALLFAKNKHTEYIKTLYPELSDDAIDRLEKALHEYRIQKYVVQKLDRTLTLIDTRLPEDDPSLHLQQIASALSTTRAYDNTATHADIFLTIEITLGITLRKDQIEKLTLFIEQLKKNEPVVLQMIMGAGKTAVLQPILSFLFADPDTLSTVIIPEALFEPVREGLSEALGSSFEQLLFTLPYDRELAKDTQFLDTFYANIQEAKKRGGCLLITPRQKHSIITSLYEAYYDKDRIRIEKIAAICNFLEIHEKDQIDEIDMVGNSRIIFKFPIGEKKPVDIDRATILSELLIDIATDDAFQEIVALDFSTKIQQRTNSQFETKAAMPSAHLYDEKIKAFLCKKAISYLKMHDPALSAVLQKDTEHYIESFLLQKTPFDDAIFEQVSKQEAIELEKKLPTKISEIEEAIKTISDPIQILLLKKALFIQTRNSWIKNNIRDIATLQLIGVCSHAIQNILPQSLLSECGAHYGIDPNDEIFVARPYEAPQAPKPTIHSDPYQQVIFSTQMALYYGIPDAASKMMFEKLKQDAVLEMKQSRVSLKETDAYKELARIVGMRDDLVTLIHDTPSPHLIEAYQKNASVDKKSLLAFMQRFVFGQIAIYEKSVSSTPQTIFGSSALATGYTGTLHEGVLSPTMKAIAEAGTDAKTINAVQKKMKAAKSHLFVSKDSKEDLVDQTAQSFLHDPGQYVLIDSGGWLKEENIESYTKRLLESCQDKRPDIRAVAYHDMTGKIMSLEYDSDNNLIRVPIKESKYKTTEGNHLTIIQQKYETGTNILQPREAKAIMTVRNNMTLRDALQSIFRMRQILAGQSVSFYISHQTQQHIAAQFAESLFSDLDSIDSLTNSAVKDAALIAREEMKKLGGSKQEQKRCFINTFSSNLHLDSDTLFSYFAIGQALTEQDKNWLAAKQKMREVIEKPIRAILEDSSISINDRMELFSSLESFIVQTTRDDPFSLMTQKTSEQDAQTVIDNEIAYHMAILDKVPEKLKPKLLIQINKHYKAGVLHALQKCVKVEDVASLLQQKETGSEELETEVEKDRQTEKEQEIEREIETLQVSSCLSVQDKRDYDWNTLLSVGVVGFKSIQQGQFDVSGNLFLNDTLPGSDYDMPCRYFAEVTTSGRKRTLLLSDADAGQLRKAIEDPKRKKTPGVDVTIFSIDCKVIAEANKGSSLQYTKEHLMDRAIKIKLFTASPLFSKEELLRLEELLKETKEAKKTRAHFEKAIQKKPHAVAIYRGSYLQQLLDRLSKEQS